MVPARRPPLKQNLAVRRTVLEAHFRLDEHDMRLEALDQAQVQSIAAMTAHSQALAQLSSVVGELKTCTTNLQGTLVAVVQDNEAGRKLFETMFTRVLQEQAFTWLKLLVGTLVMSAPSWAGKAWSFIHGP